MVIQSALRAELDSGVLRAWTGAGKVSVVEEDGTTHEYDDSAAMSSLPGEAPRFELRGVALIGTPVVGRRCTLFRLWSSDGATWTRTDRVARHLLGAPTLKGGTYSVPLEKESWDAAPTWWDNDDQRAKTMPKTEDDPPADRMFSQMRALAKGIGAVHFPDVPPFDPDGDFDKLAVVTLGAPVRGSATARLETAAPGVVSRGDAAVRSPARSYPLPGA